MNPIGKFELFSCLFTPFFLFFSYWQCLFLLFDLLEVPSSFRSNPPRLAFPLNSYNPVKLFTVFEWGIKPVCIIVLSSSSPFHYHPHAYRYSFCSCCEKWRDWRDWREWREREERDDDQPSMELKREREREGRTRLWYKGGLTIEGEITWLTASLFCLFDPCEAWIDHFLYSSKFNSCGRKKKIFCFYTIRHDFSSLLSSIIFFSSLSSLHTSSLHLVLFHPFPPIGCIIIHSKMNVFPFHCLTFILFHPSSSSFLLVSIYFSHTEEKGTCSSKEEWRGGGGERWRGSLPHPSSPFSLPFSDSISDWVPFQSPFLRRSCPFLLIIHSFGFFCFIANRTSFYQRVRSKG